MEKARPEGSEGETKWWKVGKVMRGVGAGRGRRGGSRRL